MPSASAPKRCSWRHRTHLAQEEPASLSWSRIDVDCDNRREVYATCKLWFTIEGVLWYREGHAAQDCIAYMDTYRVYQFRAGSLSRFYLRLNNPNLRWTQSYVTDRNRPNGGCSLYFTDSRQQVLACSNAQLDPIILSKAVAMAKRLGMTEREAVSAVRSTDRIGEEKKARAIRVLRRHLR